MGEANSEPSLDRYEIVAVELPGAALLLFLASLRPSFVGASHIEPRDVTVGALGIFTIASFIAGQVIQAAANIIEEIGNRLADGFRPSPVSSLPKHRRLAFEETIVKLGVDNPSDISRFRYRTELAKDIIRIARSNDGSGSLNVFNVSYGLHRGLSAAAILALVLAAYDKNISATLAFVAVSAAVTYRAYRFSRRYEGEALRIFIDADVSVPKSAETT